MWQINKSMDILTDNFGDCQLIKSGDFNEEEFEKLPHYKFRLFDDDGYLYYEGISTDNSSEDAFAPLDDFGLPNDGCTDIKYLNSLDEWESL